MKKLIIANWKMNGTRDLVRDLAGASLAAVTGLATAPNVVICPPFPYLADVGAILAETEIRLGAQDVAVAMDEKGAQTGDVSPAMLADLGCSYVIIGHSERRARYGETDAQIAAKLAGVYGAGLIPVLCVGESAEVRATGATSAVAAVRAQIAGAFDGLSAKNIGPMRECVIAYEPIWAIGAGAAAAENDIIEMHEEIGRICHEKLASSVRLRRMYGGSVNAANAGALLALPGVEGVLVGGASLKADTFSEIIRAAAAVRS